MAQSDIIYNNKTQGFVMYRHIKDYEIKFTDSDVYDNLKPSSLLSFMEESACLSADELGFGYKAISEKDLGFIIVNNYVEFERAIKLGEKLEVNTWPLHPKHLIFLRDYEFYVDGKKVGAGTTRWCMINTKTYSMVPVADFFENGFFDGYNTERSINFANWKIPPADRSGGIVYSKKITFSDYDHYFHVNNTKYADFMTDTFTVDELRGKYTKSLQITYAKQCKMGETIDFYKNYSNGAYTIEGCINGETRVQFRVTIDEL